jgi:hypothetical protein
MKRPLLFLGSVVLLPLMLLVARSQSHADARPGEGPTAPVFDAGAQRALQAMRQKADELHATGVA